MYVKSLKHYICYLLDIQIRIPHQAPVYFSCALSALSDRFYDQRLARMHIACGKNIFHACLKRTGRSLYIRPLIDLYLKSIRYILLRSQKTGGDQYDIGIQNLFRAGRFFVDHPSGGVFFPD